MSSTVARLLNCSTLEPPEQVRIIALITASKLEPFQELDDKTKEFCEIVKIEIAKDGGIERLIKKFK